MVRSFTGFCITLLVLVTHDGTVTDDAVLAAAQAAGLRLAPAGVARSAQRSPN